MLLTDSLLPAALKSTMAPIEQVMVFSYRGTSVIVIINFHPAPWLPYLIWELQIKEKIISP